MVHSPSRIEQPMLESRILLDNPLDDPYVRRMTIYLPPGHDDISDRRYPTVYLLASHGHTGPDQMNWRPWDVDIRTRLDHMIKRGRMGHLIVVMPDMWTRFGGSQYINSAAMGRYEDYLIKEVIPMVDTNYRTIPHRDHRGIMGRSSGGFGAITQAMHHPELFSAFACQSGDLYWEYTCLPALSKMHQQLARYGGVDAFIRDIPDIRPKDSTFWELVMTVCWAAAFGDNPQAPNRFDLPIDPHSGALNEDVWARWLLHDPLRKLEMPRYIEAMRQMKAIYIDAGQFDEYQLQVGARMLHHRLSTLGVHHQFEEYPDGHRDTHYRYEESLPRLYEALR
ncbi:MAG: esterase [Chloroflexi bacterium]|nr:esterase [Chloroflexota bacterium]